MRKLSLAVAATLYAVSAFAQPGQWQEGYWDRQYGMGQQWSVAYMVNLKVESTSKAREKAVRILEQAGGRMPQGGGYYGGMGRGGQSQQFSYLLPVEKAEKVAKQLLPLGDLQQYSTQKMGMTTQLPEVREKIAAIEDEQKENAAALEKMPISKAMLASHLARLTQSRDSVEQSAGTALISLTLTDASAPDSQPVVKRAVRVGPGPANEGEAKGSLGAIRSALSIYYGDTEGRYPSTLAELTVAGKYLSKIPRIQVSTHKETDAVTLIHGVSDMAALKKKLKDTGGWAYVADPKSPLFGTVVVDCAHSDSKGTPWPEY